MGIENIGETNLPGIKVVGHIDLSKFEKFKKEPNYEKYLTFLKDKALPDLARDANSEFANFLEIDGRISLEGRESVSDKVLVDAQEEGYSKEAGKSLNEWRRDTEKNPATLTEMALTVMLYKYLKEYFIVARASDYDDYNNGVDQVLIYKPTGEVVCGFDEVIGNSGDDGGLKKAAKLEKIMARGGAQIKYGAKMQDGILVRSEVRNIPAFYMSLSKAELGELLESLQINGDKTSLVEDRIFAKLLNSLEAQAAGQNLSADLKIKTNSALEKMRACFDSHDKLAA
ncbi:MAG: hypothetical protein WCN88_01855 [Candidatus Falkowbacteria bacterium]